MKTYRFYGYGDHLVEVEGDMSEDYPLAPSVGERGSFTLLAAYSPRTCGDGVRIHVCYETSGCWSAGVSPVDEDTVVPETWRFTLHPQGRGVPAYSALLTAEVDDDAVLTWEAE